MQQIFQQVWIALPREVRNKLVEVFCLVPTGVTEIIDQTVKSDGFTNDDLKRISLENMCQYIGSEETFMRAWEITLAKVHSELHPPVGVIGQMKPSEPEVVADETVAIPEVKQEAEVKLPDESVQKIEITEEQIIDEPKEEIKFTDKQPWCTICGSKGVRHRNGCPRIIK